MTNSIRAEDEQLLERLAEEARREQREQDLERLAADALPEDVLGALRERAERDPDLAVSLAAHTPIAAARKQQIVLALRAALVPGAAHEEPASAPAAAESPQRSPSRSLRAKAQLIWPLLAAAAGVLLFLQLSRKELSAPLPGYALEVRRAVSEQRGAPAAEAAPAPLLLDPARPPVLVLRPAERVEGALAVGVFAADTAPVRELAQDVEQAEGGALRVQLRELGPLPSSGRLLVVVARAASVEDRAQLRELAQGQADTGPGWQRFRLGYRLLP
jgi:hypothetical protein